MDKAEFQTRTKQFVLRSFKLVEALPRTTTAKVIANQLVRCASSVGANYRAACRSRSKAEFISKLGTVLEEADESCYWLELIMDGNILPAKKISSLLQEAGEITAIIAAARNTSLKNLKS